MTSALNLGFGAVLAATALLGCGQRPAAEGGSAPLEMTVSNRRPISEASDFTRAGLYARSNNYYGYAANLLKPGMRVMYSASYGASGQEAGQSRGTLEQGADGGLYFRQEDNTTSQMMLPPGLAWDNGGEGVSLWEMKSYLDLINRVAFAEASAARAPGETPNAGPAVYSALSAYQVDFEGGTAGQTVDYRDAMELTLQKSPGNGTKSDVSVYFAKGIGAVALEFKESGSVGGTFKIYIGAQ
jgi:hypothetical protein